MPKKRSAHTACIRPCTKEESKEQRHRAKGSLWVRSVRPWKGWRSQTYSVRAAELCSHTEQLQTFPQEAVRFLHFADPGEQRAELFLQRPWGTACGYCCLRGVTVHPNGPHSSASHRHPPEERGSDLACVWRLVFKSGIALEKWHQEEKNNLLKSSPAAYPHPLI